MRDFRDAKIMAQTLRETLQAKAVPISHSESLEMVSKIFGMNDWNTLSAVLKTERPEASATSKSPPSALAYPAIPVRDFVPFPAMHFPLFISREKTLLALERAFEGHREIVVAVQNDPSVDEPNFTNIYKIGVLAVLVDIQLLPEVHIYKGKTYNGTTKVLLQAHRRITITRFTADDGAFLVEITNISEGKIPEAPELIAQAVERFENYTAPKENDVEKARSIELARPNVSRIHDPGRVADIIAAYLRLPISDKQALLETVDPVARLEKVIAVLTPAGVAKSP